MIRCTNCSYSFPVVFSCWWIQTNPLFLFSGSSLQVTHGHLSSPPSQPSLSSMVSHHHPSIINGLGSPYSVITSSSLGSPSASLPTTSSMGYGALNSPQVQYRERDSCSQLGPNIWNNSDFKMFLKGVSYALHDCIYMIQNSKNSNTVKSYWSFI